MLNNLKSAIRNAQNMLNSSAQAMIEASGEYILWRHQLIGQRNPLSDNALGIDPGGKVWKTKDFIVHGIRQGQDQKDRHVFYIQGEPIVSDLLITLQGLPKTKEQARYAPRAGYFKIVDTDVRRTPENRIIYTKCIVVPDRTGQWHDYEKTGDQVNGG